MAYPERQDRGARLMALKLSEAIRAGAKLRPMATGVYFDYVDEGTTLSCALGAAYEAVMGKAWGTAKEIGQAIRGEYPCLKEHWDGGNLLYGIIADMNDSGKFTREEIADWLESCGL